MKWFDELKKMGLYPKQLKFYNEYLTYYQDYDLLIVGDEEYTHLINQKEIALVEADLKIVKKLATIEDYKNLETYYDDRIAKQLKKLQNKVIIGQHIKKMMKMMNKTLIKNKLFSEKIVALPASPEHLQTHDYYYQVAIRIQQIKQAIINLQRSRTK